MKIRSSLIAVTIHFIHRSHRSLRIDWVCLRLRPLPVPRAARRGLRFDDLRARSPDLGTVGLRLGRITRHSESARILAVFGARPEAAGFVPRNVLGSADLVLILSCAITPVKPAPRQFDGQRPRRGSAI